ncbi:hypothetical protein [Paenibacillus alvei]|uniref:Uncharacterized protein n=1 Tax=Paenibacillus alvei TaxID=44250 RepID=A0ABT4H7N1_PAEAL|nr:hypothetical protein [Paenibacillus alvei]MCY9764634.1 hypothetical protein [Paenibacillus alvei]
MTLDQRIVGLFQRVQLPGSLQPPCAWNIVQRTVWFQLIEEPEPLLGIRCRHMHASFHRLNRRTFLPFSPLS